MITLLVIVLVEIQLNYFKSKFCYYSNNNYNNKQIMDYSGSYFNYFD